MLRLGVAPDLATLNALIDAYVRNARLADAERVLAEMAPQHGVTPSARSFNTLLKGYAKAGRLRVGFGVVRRLRETLGALWDAAQQQQRRLLLRELRRVQRLV